MLLFVLHALWSIIDDSGSVVSSVVSSHPALLSFHMLAGNLDRAPASLQVRWETADQTCPQEYTKIPRAHAGNGEGEQANHDGQADCPTESMGAVGVI